MSSGRDSDTNDIPPARNPIETQKCAASDKHNISRRDLSSPLTYRGDIQTLPVFKLPEDGSKHGYIAMIHNRLRVHEFCHSKKCGPSMNRSKQHNQQEGEEAACHLLRALT